MIIPSFTGFAPGPNTAQSYLGGIQSAQKDREIEQTGAIANQRFGLEQQQLAQSAQNASMALQQRQQALQQEQQQAMMRADIQKKQLEQQSFLKQQEINIRQQYDTQRAALESAKVQTAHQNLQLKIAEAQQKFNAQSQYSEFIKGGGDASEGVRKFGPMMGLNGAAMGNALRTQASLPELKATEVPGLEGVMSVPSGINSRQFFDVRKNDLQERRLEGQLEGSKSRMEHTRLKDLIDAQKNDDDGSTALLLEKNGDKLTAEQKAAAAEYRRRGALIRQLTLGGGEAEAPAPAAANEVVKLYKGKRAIFNKDTKEFIRYE
jgi:hypothetical protein